jgi:hypothetical protein
MVFSFSGTWLKTAAGKGIPTSIQVSPSFVLITSITV